MSPLKPPDQFIYYLKQVFQCFLAVQFLSLNNLSKHFQRMKEQQSGTLKTRLITSQIFPYTHKSSFKPQNHAVNVDFKHQIININSRELLEVYQERMEEAVPNTPKIFITKWHRDTSKLQMLVEKGSGSLQKYLGKSQNNETLILIGLRQVIKAIETLVKKYGYFSIKRSMIKFSSSSGLLVWINSQFSSNHRELPLNPITHSEGICQLFTDIVTVLKFNSTSRVLQEIMQQIGLQNLLTFEKIYHYINAQEDKQKSKALGKVLSMQLLPSKKNFVNIFQQQQCIDNKRMENYQNSGKKMKNEEGKELENECQQMPKRIEEKKWGKKTLFFHKNQNAQRRERKITKEQQKNPANPSKKETMTLQSMKNLKRYASMSPKCFRKTSTIFTPMKNDIRNSGNSSAATTFTASITSSGNRKTLHAEQESEHLPCQVEGVLKVIQQNRDSHQKDRVERSSLASYSISEGSEMIEDFKHLMSCRNSIPSEDQPTDLIQLEAAVEHLFK